MVNRPGLGTASATAEAMDERLRSLESHLQRENPAMLDIVKSFRQLDKVAFRLGLLARNQSFATLVPWWPLIAVVGTFSSGKSTFINQFLGTKIQRTGNQAVDDKFTVLCFSAQDSVRTLPGLALDADPRFPLYRISRELEQVEVGEGSRVDTYLQLKTVPSAALKGKILIDSPGFDADEQRTSVLRITDHILNLSDLVLVLFDARHPEPGAMQDTLEHLVANTINRTDSEKFLYILNQVDNTAREDNPEEVFAAWQRALAQKGLTAGRFYRIYDPDSAIDMVDADIKKRFETKRAEDLEAIMSRINEVEVGRMYRIIGVLEKTAHAIEDELVPSIQSAKVRWKKRVLWSHAIVFSAMFVAALALTIWAGYWEGIRFAPPWWDRLVQSAWLKSVSVVAFLGIIGYIHFGIRKMAARAVRRAIEKQRGSSSEHQRWLLNAFDKNTASWRPVLLTRPAGWGHFTRRRLERILTQADAFVQDLNNRFASPSGKNAQRPMPNAVPGESTREVIHESEPDNNPGLETEPMHKSDEAPKADSAPRAPAEPQR